MCLYPRLIDNAKYKPNKKNGGRVPPFSDNRVLLVPIACGNCIECRKQKSREWQVRMLEDIKTNPNGRMITLTFSNESIKHINSKLPDTYTDRRNKIHALTGYKRDNAIAAYAVEHFRERWRKKYKVSIRHWLITELGHKGTENIHMHGIIWPNLTIPWQQQMNEIEKIWQYGWIWKWKIFGGQRQNYVNGRTVNYTIKYLSKIDKDHPHFKGRVLSSPGIGNNYTKTPQSQRNKFNEANTKETYKSPSGHEIAMPIYWRNKLYTEEEREALWLHKLDKQERYICGERIDISKGEEEYYELLKHYKTINRRLGYGSSFKPWEQIEYENKRRELLLNKRIKNKKE